MALASSQSSLLAAQGRLGRAAVFAFRTTAVAAIGSLVGCGDDQPPTPPVQQQIPEETIAQPYGAPPEPPPPVPPTPPTPPTPPPLVPPDTTIAQPYGAPPIPDPQPPIDPDDPGEDPPTHDHEERRRPPRTVTVPAYGISPRHYGPGDDLE